ncbi:hypothetical protein Goarm_009935 [Gossypium armourianum]|uniref:Pectate lyase n=1 Tax=Gossypium armourianum TaxID=34283 RepID=A0A7J9JUL3_9ROSI|nr:hypothetical protein [Gossypium armourianum]
MLFIVVIPTLEAHIAEYDEYWRARELEAIENLYKAYRPNPEKVVRHYNDHFSRTMLEFFITKSVLAKSKKGPYEVTNPVDSCWRCDSDWEKNRKNLVNCAPGFAHGTTGGKGGEFYVATDPIDNAAGCKPGTLRHAVTQTGPLWITFKRSMTIKLEQELIVTSDKSIDVKGTNMEIRNATGITVQFVKNVIIHGLHIHQIIPTKGGKIKDGEKHLGLRSASDVMFGASDSYNADEKMQVTIALNHFGKGLVERMPSISHPTIISQGNRYSAPGTFVAKEVTCRGLFENSGFLPPSGNSSASKQFGADKMMHFKPNQLVPKLIKYAGHPC